MRLLIPSAFASPAYKDQYPKRPQLECISQVYRWSIIISNVRLQDLRVLLVQCGQVPWAGARPLLPRVLVLQEGVWGEPVLLLLWLDWGWLQLLLGWHRLLHSRHCQGGQSRCPATVIVYACIICSYYWCLRHYFERKLIKTGNNPTVSSIIALI